MADNVAITAGAGTSIATDDITGAHYQKVKIALGQDGTLDGLLDPGQTTLANSLPVAIASDQTAIPVTDNSGSLTIDGSVALTATEVHVGEVGGNSDIVDVTLSLDTSAYSNGDVLAETQAVASAVRVAAGKAVLHSIVLNDKDDQGAALDLVFLRTNVSLGTKNAAPSITDANADEILGIVSVISTDWIDLGGCKIATLRNVGLLLEAGAAATSIFIAAITRGAPTHTASGITLRLGLLRD